MILQIIKRYLRHLYMHLNVLQCHFSLIVTSVLRNSSGLIGCFEMHFRQSGVKSWFKFSSVLIDVSVIEQLVGQKNKLVLCRCLWEPFLFKLPSKQTAAFCSAASCYPTFSTVHSFTSGIRRSGRLGLHTHARTRTYTQTCVPPWIQCYNVGLWLEGVLPSGSLKLLCRCFDAQQWGVCLWCGSMLLFAHTHTQGNACMHKYTQKVNRDLSWNTGVHKYT